jgi:hypothetical protein
MAALIPLPVSDWYAAFLEISTELPTFDPWEAWIASGGDQVAFPYGFSMWFAFLPAALVFKALGIPLEYAHALTVLAADVTLLGVIATIIPARPKFLLSVYWLSPIVILASYLLGYNDLIPVLLLLVSIHFVRRVSLQVAGVALAAAVSAKLSMSIALPIFLIYFFNNKRLRPQMGGFVYAFLIATAVLWLPFLLSSSAVGMLFSNPEMGKIYQLALNFGGEFSIFLVPLLYWLGLYFLWRLKRVNFDIFCAALGMAFLLLVLMTPAAPGWFIWTIPFLCFYQYSSDRVSVLLVAGFSWLYAISTILVAPLQGFNGDTFDFLEKLVAMFDYGGLSASLVHTAMLAVGVVLAQRMWREADS